MKIPSLKFLSFGEDLYEKELKDLKRKNSKLE